MIDLDKPLTPGAFCDVSKIKQYTEDDYILPETPPFSWLMKKTKVCVVFRNLFPTLALLRIVKSK